MKRLEALADAFANMHRALDPSSDAYRLRNPIMLKAFAPKHERDESGHRRFRSFVAGYENALLDLRIKCSGQSRAKLSRGSQLIELVTTYGNPPTAVKIVVKFLREALRDESISAAQALEWFLEEKNVNTTYSCGAESSGLGDDPNRAEPTAAAATATSSS